MNVMKIKRHKIKASTLDSKISDDVSYKTFGNLTNLNKILKFSLQIHHS